MGFFVKLLLKAGVTLGVMYIGYTYMLGGGIGGFQMPGAAKEAVKGLKGLGNAVVKKDVTVYQWVDEKGITHFGGSAPTGRGAYETKVISSNTNVMQLKKKAEEEQPDAESGFKSRVTRVGKAYTPENIRGTIDDASNIKKMMEDRAKQQNKLLEGM